MATCLSVSLTVRDLCFIHCLFTIFLLSGLLYNYLSFRMDYKEQQEQEIEALKAIYQEDELEIESENYPNISLRIHLKSNQVCFYLYHFYGGIHQLTEFL